MKTGISFFLAGFVSISWLWGGNSAGATVGATTPFTSVEAESGLLSGGATVVYLTNAPTTEYSSPQLEASGHAYVALTATNQSVTITNTTGGNITALNLRSCIPDAPTGGGISSTIDLYVNGVFNQAFAVNSAQNYAYNGGTNYGSTTDKNPSDGDPRDFWNDTHAFIAGAAVAPGGTLTFQMDATNTAAFYYIDVIDLENPVALSQPANSLSIVTYGAVSNSISTDNTTAINNCFKACKSQGKIAWIPPGTWYISAVSGGLSGTSITITGAGPWFSTIYRVTPANNTQGIANIITTTSCTVENLALDCNATSRLGNDNNGAVNSAGNNWVVSNVWIQHVTSSFWCAGNGGIAENCRTLSTWADGGNFNNQQSGNGIGMNLTYSNNFVRGTGDDGMAINSVNYNVNGSTTNYYTIMSNITYVNNTAIDPWGGHNLSIYGGINVVLKNNLLTDSSWEAGLSIGQFGANGSPTLSATVTGNVLLRCGANCYGQQQQGLGLGGTYQQFGPTMNLYCASNTISNSLYAGVAIQPGTNVVFESNTISAPGLDGIDILSGPGYIVLNHNTVTGINSGRSAYKDSASSYVVGGISNSGFTVSGSIPTPWLGQDIGAVGVAGGNSYSQSVFSIIGSGAGIGGTNDAFHFTYQPFTGNCMVSTEVTAEELFNPSAQAGVMIRNSLNPGDLEASVLVTPTGILFATRSTNGGPSTITTNAGPLSYYPYPVANGGTTFTTANTSLLVPYWVSLTRNGNTFTGSYSSNGVNWTEVGAPTALAMGTNTYVGTAISSSANGAASSAMMGVTSVGVPSAVSAAVRWEGDLIANLQSVDLNAGSSVWSNRTSDANGVGNFSTTGGNLDVAALTWNLQSVNALFVNDTIGNAVSSALNVPAEIAGNNPVSAEAWIYATAVGQQNSCAVGYGIEGGPLLPEEDREFNYNTQSSGGVSGDFGTYDTPWATTPAAGAWHYLAWTYNGTSVKLYLDAVLNASNSPGSPLQTPATVIGVGASLDSSSNLTVDAFEGYIAAARVESGLLTQADMANNYALGPMGTATALTPSGLTATASNGLVVLTWNASSNAASYNLASSTMNGGPYTLIATNLTALGFTNTGLEDGYTYYYVVSAVNIAGTSSNSAPVSARPVGPYPAVHWVGDLIANLQSVDLNAGSSVWNNRSSNSNSVGNFSTTGGNLNVASMTWNAQSVKALYVDDTTSDAVQSALKVPTEIISNNPVSAEAWIYATAVTQQNSCAIGYGLQGGSGAPEEDREFNYSTPGSGGGVSGDFGTYDTSWATTPAAGAWHYLAWTYDGSTVRLYLDGVLNASHSPSSPLITPATYLGVGAGLSGGPNIAVDAFQGYIAVARIASGVLTPTDIATNYALGLLATAAAVTPSGLTAVASPGRVVLSWSDPGDATSFNLASSTASNGTYTVIATNLTVFSYTNAGLSNGTIYYFTVAGVNSAGVSSNSAPVSAQPISLTPPLFDFALNGGQLQLTWPQSNTGWSLQAQTNSPGQGLGTNWVTIPASALTNQMTIPIGSTNGSVFFRLIYP